VGVPSATDAGAREPSERIRVLRELGARTSVGGTDAAVCAALDAGGGRARLVVVERVVRSGGVGAQDVAAWLANAKRLVPLEHPNVGRVRDAIDGAAAAYVVSDFIDGARWADVVGAGSGLPLDIAVRVLLDALAGLGALHNMRDASRQPLGLVHCGVTSESVLIGLDGVTRVLGTARLRGQVPGFGAHYLAPEVLLEDDAADARADVYSAGVLLWEALSGRPLFTETGASAIVTAVLSGRVPRAEAPAGAPWAAPLVDVAARALSPDPQKRYASAAAMAAELRRIGGVKIVPSIRVAALVRSAFGERIKARREELERGDAGVRVASGTAAIALRTAVVEEAAPSSDVPTPVPVVPTATATTRPPPPLATEAPRALAPIAIATAPAPVAATMSDPPMSVEPSELLSIDSIPVAVSTSGAPGSDARVTDPAPADERATDPVPKAVRAAAGAPHADEEGTRDAVLTAPLVPRELRSEPSATAAAPLATATLEPSVVASDPPRGHIVRNKRMVMAAIIAGSLAIVAVAAAMWMGGKEEGKEKEGAAASPVAVGSSATATATPTPTTTPTATATATPPVAVAPDTPPPTDSASAVPAAPPKPKPVIKYDPQGI
jgi:hypothetical protein